MSFVPQLVLSEELAAHFKTFNYGELQQRQEQEKQNEPVPSQWPDPPTSMPELHDESATQTLSASSAQIEYGVLSLNIWNLRSNIQGNWKLRAILEHNDSYTDYDLQWCPILQFGPGSGSAGAGTTLRCDMSLREKTCTAVLHLFFEGYTDSSQSHRDGTVMSLGSIDLGLFSESSTRKWESHPLRGGTVEIDITLTFSREQLPNLQDRTSEKWRLHPYCDLGSLDLVNATDTHVFYLMATIRVEDYCQGSATFSLDNPWILPVRFPYKSPGHFHFLSPLSSSWHLLGLVQRCRRMMNEETQIYAAQLVCALESLHSLGRVGLLSSENVLVDVFGNIRITTPRLFTNDPNPCLGQSAYTAPEILSGDTPSQVTDWWILGCFLYETLTGLPPFHSQDPAERDCKILKEEPCIPSYLPTNTADILRRLLHRPTNERLGAAGGASEIRKHNFFHGVNWEGLRAGNSKLSPFQTNDIKSILANSPRRPRSPSPAEDPSALKEPPKRRYLEGNFIHEVGGFMWREGPKWRLRRSSDIFNPLLSEPIVEAQSGPDQTAARALQGDSDREGFDTEAVMARLKAALQNNQSTEKVAYILDGCTDQVRVSVLKSPILVVNETPINTITHVTSDDIPINALEWTVELGRVDLVLLLLNRGADSNWTFDQRYGPALTRAARERRAELVDILAPKTSRILAIRTLCLAVEQRDMLTARCLLSHGVHSDFDVADHLLGRPLTSQYDWYHGEGFNSWCPAPTFHLGPLVRATRHGDVAMVRLLLSYGADPNTTYHDMTNLAPETHATWEDAVESRYIWNPGFVCGRVVQLAMLLGHGDVVDALLDGGADVWLPQPEWPVRDHFCPLVPRSIYLQVAGGLEEARDRVGRVSG